MEAFETCELFKQPETKAHQLIELKMLIDFNIIKEKQEIARNTSEKHKNVENEICSLINEYESSYLSDNDPRKACILDRS